MRKPARATFADENAERTTGGAETMDNIRDFSLAVCEELSATLARVKEEQVRALYDALMTRRDRQIFVCGAGRCQYMLRAFCMRLMHLGFQAHVVGDTATPRLNSGDLLILADGAGGLTTIAAVARLAKTSGAQIAFLTIVPDSLIGREADIIIEIPGRTAAAGGIGESIQPGGGRYEQSLLILLDSIVAAIVEELELDRGAPFARHTNLE